MIQADQMEIKIIYNRFLIRAQKKNRQDKKSIWENK